MEILVLLADLSCCTIASTARMIPSDGALESRDPQLSNALLESFIRPLRPKLRPTHPILKNLRSVALACQEHVSRSQILPKEIYIKKIQNSIQITGTTGLAKCGIQRHKSCSGRGRNFESNILVFFSLPEML